MPADRNNTSLERKNLTDLTVLSLVHDQMVHIVSVEVPDFDQAIISRRVDLGELLVELHACHFSGGTMQLVQTLDLLTAFDEPHVNVAVLGHCDYLVTDLVECDSHHGLVVRLSAVSYFRFDLHHEQSVAEGDE